MAVQLNIPYETLVELVKQLPSEEQESLIQALQQPKQSFSENARKALFDELLLDTTQLKQEPSIRREDWYGDDGR